VELFIKSFQKKNFWYRKYDGRNNIYGTIFERNYKNMRNNTNKMIAVCFIKNPEKLLIFFRIVLSI
jgi:hypothetical protein